MFNNELNCYFSFFLLILNILLNPIIILFTSVLNTQYLNMLLNERMWYFFFFNFFSKFVGIHSTLCLSSVYLCSTYFPRDLLPVPVHVHRPVVEPTAQPVIWQYIYLKPVVRIRIRIRRIRNYFVFVYPDPEPGV